MRKGLLLSAVAILLAAYVGAGSVRHFVWDNYRRYEFLPWLIPGPERIARSLLAESICRPTGQPDTRTLLEQAGYRHSAEDDDPFSTEVEFTPPLKLSAPEFDIAGWEIVRYFWAGDSGGESGIEVAQPPDVVARSLHLPAAQARQTLHTRTTAFTMQGELGIDLTATERGTRIGCWFTDG